MGQAEINKILKKSNILIEGDNPPPPIKAFTDLRIDERILKVLTKLTYKKPTPI
jgi:ATP-dependent RNA helicase DDX41